MSESIGPISSAVVVPEAEVQKSPTSKRRQSSTSDTVSKRPRLSHDEHGDSPSTLRASPQATEPTPEPPIIPQVEKEKDEVSKRRNSSSAQEEKKRGRRLFGGLLSTLSQSTPNGQHKRRLEIEKRQAEKARQQQVDDEAQRAEKLAKLKAIRKVEQIKFNGESMRIRHSNMLAMANFLCTKTEPKLYYKPWELRPEEEDCIKTQIAEVEALIEREREEFDRLYQEERGQETSEDGDKTNNMSKETLGEPHTESPSISNVDTTNPPVQAPQSDQITTEKHSLEEHNGEVIVEAEEDTVIY